MQLYAYIQNDNSCNILFSRANKTFKAKRKKQKRRNISKWIREVIILQATKYSYIPILLDHNSHRIGQEPQEEIKV